MESVLGACSLCFGLRTAVHVRGVEEAVDKIVQPISNSACDLVSNVSHTHKFEIFNALHCGPSACHMFRQSRGSILGTFTPGNNDFIGRRVKKYTLSRNLEAIW